jgi:NADP-dependent 3-hydroxy acid dehydrogenase YdfG
MQLTNSRVAILGSSTGIGFATAKAASAEGAIVTIAGRSPEKLKAAKAALGNKVEAVVLDVNDEAVRSTIMAPP